MFHETAPASAGFQVFSSQLKGSKKLSLHKAVELTEAATQNSHCSTADNHHQTDLPIEECFKYHRSYSHYDLIHI